MKKILTILLSFFILLGCNNSKNKTNNNNNNNNSDSKTYKIGVVLPLTGSAAVWGKNAKMGIDIAITEFEKQGIKIELFVEDSKSETKTAVSAFEKMISSKKVHLVIGDIASSSVLAMAPIANKNKVVLLSPGASNPDITNAGDFVFRNWQSDALEGKIDADFTINDLNKNRIAVLYVNNAYGTGLKESYIERIKELNQEIIICESFEQGAKNVRTQLQKIKNETPDLVYMPGYPPEMAIALKQMKEIGFETQVLSTQSFDDPEIIKIAGNASNGVIYSIPKPPDSAGSVVKEFTTKYKKAFNIEPGVCSDTGYDALKIAIWALKDKNAKNGTEIKDAFYNLKNFDGAAGKTEFDSNGDVVKDFKFKIIKNKTSISYE